MTRVAAAAVVDATTTEDAVDVMTTAVEVVDVEATRVVAETHLAGMTPTIDEEAIRKTGVEVEMAAHAGMIPVAGDEMDSKRCFNRMILSFDLSSWC